MKKLFTLVLAVALVFAMATTCFAATISGSGSLPAQNTATQAVQAKYQAGDTVDTVIYSVDVAFTGIQLTYKGASTGEWQPASHSYATGDAAGWVSGDNTVEVTVTNHSNADVNAAVAYEAAQTNGLAGSFDKESEDIDTGVGLTYETADKATFVLTITGTPATTATEFYDIGTITVTITAAA